ncbi:MAG TPA: lysoplasmalogenase [Candidatus Sulfotelmatobacter sp.]|nr:lysoplasmalogenase [Candidatus Sulfotelmatobacter sp.]
MTDATRFLLAIAAVVAVVDWWAADTARARLEAVAKPAVILLLMGVALTLSATNELARGLVVAALICSLVGDVALLRRNVATLFAVGLAAFLAAHLGYIGAMILDGGDTSIGPALAVAATVIVAVGGWQIGWRLIGAVRRVRPELATPVGAYVAVISLMVVAAWATGRPTAILGSLAFYTSDSLLGWDRFVRPLPHRSLLVMTTYHVGQALLVLSLAG